LAEAIEISSFLPALERILLLEEPNRQALKNGTLNAKDHEANSRLMVSKME